MLSSSPAINAGDPNFDPNVFTPPLVNDQRGTGFDRLIGGRIDIGAFEDQNAPLVPPIDIDTNVNEVAEGVAVGESVGITANVVGTITYSLVDNAGGRFQIDSGTGVVTVLDSSTFDGPESYTITVEAEDQGGATSTADFTINVLNVAPSLSPLIVTQSIVTEGNSTTVQGSFSDGALGVPSETFTGTATWSDGATTPVIINPDGTFTSTRTFDDDNPSGTPSDDYTVTITISDDDGGSDTAVSPTVTVLNVAPVIGALSVTQSTVVEGNSTTVLGSFTDPALGVASETLTATATWSDGETTTVTINSDGTFSTTRTFSDDNPTGTPSDEYTVTITITDDDGGSDTAVSPTVTVLNTAPVIDQLSVTQSTVVESFSTTVNGSFTDLALGVATETFTATATWSDGETTPVTLNADGTFSTSRFFDDDNPTGTPSDDYTVSITITDDDGGSDTAVSPVVTVLNAAPVIGALSVSQSTVVESFSTTVSGSFTDLALGIATETFIGSATWSDGQTTLVTINPDGTFSTTRVFADDDPTGTPSDDYTVTITITDDDGGSDSAVSPVVTVLNAAPTIDSLVSDGNISISGTFSDLGALDTHTISVNWGDGTPLESINLNQAAGTFDGDHNYSAIGDYTIFVTLTDDDGAIVVQSIMVTVTEVPGPKTYFVDITADENDGNFDPGDLSLREAVALANANPFADTIIFATALAGSEIDLTLGELLITDAVTIDASSLTSNVVIDAQQQSRAINFTAPSGHLNINGLTLQNGVTTLATPFNGDTHAGGGIRFLSNGELTLTGSTLSANRTEGDESRGGGIFTSSGVVTLVDSMLIGNSTTGFSANGGGIFTGSGAVTLISSTLSGNSTSGSFSRGGGVFTFSGNVTLTESTLSGNSTSGVVAVGGGISADAGVVSLTGSTVSGNSTSGIQSPGGGIFSFGGAVMVTNSTVSGNSTTAGSSDGGGIYTNSSALTFTSSTITGNSTLASDSDGGGIFIADSIANPPLTMHNTIVAGNTTTGIGPDLVLDPDSTLDVKFSLIGDNAGAPALAEAQTPDANGNLIGSAAGGGIINPLLAPLSDNGGATQTHALLPASPAIDAGDPTAIAGQNGVPNFDQRGTGFDRVISGRIDIGAYETPDLIAPQVENIDIQDGSEQRSVIRSITVNFDSIVTADAGAFVLTTSDGQMVDVSAVLSIVDGKTQAVLTFSGAFADATGSLIDGNYSLRVVDSLIHDLAGNAADSDGDGTSGDDLTDDFFRLYGDADGDGSVGFLDLALFRSALFAMEGDKNFNIAFDANGDGVINLLDIQAFRNNFGATNGK